MAEPEDTDAVVEQPTNVEKLRDFILAHMPDSVDIVGDIDRGPQFNEDNAADLAHAILSEFLRTDVDAQNIFARPGVDSNTLDAFAIVTWGPMVGRLAPVELRATALAFLEVAETADVESGFVRWLVTGEGGTREGATSILQSFRRFRVETEAGT